MSKHPSINGPNDEFEEPSDEFKARIEELTRNNELKPGLDLLEQYVHPLTGEVLIEGGPDTPETRTAREETAKWWAETVGKPWKPQHSNPADESTE